MNNNEPDGSGVGMFLLGWGCLGAGIPLTIVGGISIHKYKTLIEESKSTASLSFGTTSNGIGLTLKF